MYPIAQIQQSAKPPQYSCRHEGAGREHWQETLAEEEDWRHAINELQVVQV